MWLASAAFAIVYSLLGENRYATYHSGADLGIFMQALQNESVHFGNTLEAGSHYLFHFSPVLELLAPFIRRTHDPAILIVVQALACALVAPAIFSIARTRMDERLALGVALIALVYPPLAGVTFTDFHENAFAAAGAAWLIVALDRRRFGLAALCVLVLLGTKEDEAPIVAAVGVLAAIWFLRRGDANGVRFALGATFVASVVFVAYFALVRPLVGATEAWNPLHFYAWNGGPGDSAGLDLRGRLTYLLEALVPLVFLPFGTPAMLLALPGFAEVLGSHLSITYTMGQHYAAVWIGPLLVAFACGVARLAATDRSRAVRLLRACAVICVLDLAVASPTHWGHFLRARTAHDAVLDRAIAGLPANLDVGTFDEAYAHLGRDSHAYSSAKALRPNVLDDLAYHSRTWDAVRAQLDAEIAAGAARIVSSDDGVRLVARSHG